MQFYQVALLGFVPLTLLLFAMLPARRAMVMAVVGGALFLPEGRGLPIFGFEALGYFKASAITFGCGLGVLLFDTNRLLSFRPRWFDGFAVVLGVTGIISSLTNGLGFRDGIFEAVIAIWLWTIPYFLGRLYFSDLAGIRELAIGIVGGAVAYVPLCLIEIRMSPQLHSWVYGYAQHQFAQSIRFGGYRPVVFLPHGLAVGVYMAVASIIAWWLWSTKSVTRLWGVPSG
ncbi:MAG TPA: hypothetical protein VK324_05345, partial [Tepidisphaeraceae bacterium]|nr:hypothetical protein [Tepidisphaeraceae bacterium]